MNRLVFFFISVVFLASRAPTVHKAFEGWCVSHAASYSAGPPDTVTLRVLIESGEALPGVTVEVKQQTGPVSVCTTDRKGMAKMLLPAGNWTATLEFPDFITMTAVFTVESGKSRYLSMTMPLDPNPPKIRGCGPWLIDLEHTSMKFTIGEQFFRNIPGG
jgi:hypothetical protein